MYLQTLHKTQSKQSILNSHLPKISILNLNLNKGFKQNTDGVHLHFKIRTQVNVFLEDKRGNHLCEEMKTQIPSEACSIKVNVSRFIIRIKYSQGHRGKI